MSLFTTIINIVRTRQVALTLFGRQFLIRFDPSRHDPVDHVLWNILAFNLSGGIDRYSAQVEGFVAVLGFTVEIDLALSRIATGGLTVTASTPLFEASLTAGVYLPVPEEQPVRDRLAEVRAQVDKATADLEASRGIGQSEGGGRRDA